MWSFSSPWQLLLLGSFWTHSSWSRSTEQSGWTLKAAFLLLLHNLLPLLQRAQDVFSSPFLFEISVHWISASQTCMAFQHIPASSSSDTHFITSMTQKFKARVHGCGGDKRHTLNLASRMKTGSCDPFSTLTVKDWLYPRKLSEPFRNGMGQPSIQKSKEHFVFPNNWLTLPTVTDFVRWFGCLLPAVEKENKTVSSRISGPITLEHLCLSLYLLKLQVIHLEDSSAQGCTSLTAQYLLTT